MVDDGVFANDLDEKSLAFGTERLNLGDFVGRKKAKVI